MKFLIIICFILISPIIKAGPGGIGSNPTMMSQSHYEIMESQNINNNAEIMFNNLSKKIELNKNLTIKEIAQKLLDNDLISNDAYNDMLDNELNLTK